MDEARREAFKRAGGIETTPEEWLGLNEVDCEVIEFRLRIARVIRCRRMAASATPEEFAARCGTTRSILNRIENGVEANYNRMMKVYFACGAKAKDLASAEVTPPAIQALA